MRMKSSTQITTQEGARIAKRLLNHWKHKFEVQEQADSLHIIMPDAALALIPQAEQLDVKLETQREDYAVLEKVIIDHLDRMAQQQFEVEWQHQP